MNSWKTQMMRSGTAASYFNEYASGKARSPWLSYACDLEEISGEPYRPNTLDTDISEEWLRRFVTGYINGKTGHHVITIPKPIRLRKLEAHLGNFYLPEAAIADHTGTHDQAVTVAEEKGILNLADPRILSGALWGMYTADISKTRTAVLFIHFLKGDDVFRVRLFEFRTDSPEHAAELVRIEDGFLTTGTSYGYVFCLQGLDFQMMPIDAPHRSAAIGDYQFNIVQSKTGPKIGRRILEFTWQTDSVFEASIRFRLCRSSNDIDTALTLLGSVGLPPEPPLEYA